LYVSVRYFTRSCSILATWSGNCFFNSSPIK
jgi:hypothetical protein